MLTPSDRKEPDPTTISCRARVLRSGVPARATIVFGHEMPGSGLIAEAQSAALPNGLISKSRGERDHESSLDDPRLSGCWRCPGPRDPAGRRAEFQLELPLPSAGKLPRWRGFNLLEMFHHGNDGPFHEEDFELISELGFNFVRLPLDYRCWTDPADWTKIRDEVLDRLTQAVEFGQKHGVHVQLNFHRAPGYTVARPAEARSLWNDAKAQEVCARHWGHFARRFQGVSNTQVSFNLFNEPSNVDGHTYRTVVERMIRAIREQDRDRLIVCDGRDWGKTPPVELAGLGVAAATRGYEPFHLTHYRASWVQGSDRWPKPSYPLHDQGTTWDRQLLKKRAHRPLERAGELWRRRDGRRIRRL